MEKLKALEEAIKLDAQQFIYNMEQIKELNKLFVSENHHKIRQLWAASEKLVHKMKHVEYGEEHLLPVVKKRLIALLKDAEKNLSLL